MTVTNVRRRAEDALARAEERGGRTAHVSVAALRELLARDEDLTALEEWAATELPKLRTLVRIPRTPRVARAA